MKRTSAAFVAAALIVQTLSASACAPGYYSSGGASTYMGFMVGVSNAPPPPRVYYRSRPQFLFTVSSGVRVVEAPGPDYDMFFYGGNYYMYHSGYWYRCRTYDGTYALVEVRRVPRAVLQVPAAHWRHHPGKGHGRGQGKHDRDDRGRDKHDRDRDRS